MAEAIYSNEGHYKEISCAHPEVSSFCRMITLMVRESPTIHVADDAYCAYVRLFSGNYFCINSQQAAIETAIDPGQAGYCDGQTFICPPKLEF